MVCFLMTRDGRLPHNNKSKAKAKQVFTLTRLGSLARSTNGSLFPSRSLVRGVHSLFIDQGCVLKRRLALVYLLAYLTSYSLLSSYTKQTGLFVRALSPTSTSLLPVGLQSNTLLSNPLEHQPSSSVINRHRFSHSLPSFPHASIHHIHTSPTPHPHTTPPPPYTPDPPTATAPATPAPPLPPPAHSLPPATATTRPTAATAASTPSGRVGGRGRPRRATGPPTPPPEGERGAGVGAGGRRGGRRTRGCAPRRPVA